VGPTRSSPNGFGASGSGDLPPPPPMTPTEAFMATQTEVLRQILQTQRAHRGRSVVPGVPLVVLLALTDGPRLRPDSPRVGCGQSVVPGRTVRAAHRGRSALSGRTVRLRLRSLLLGSIPLLLSCFRVCFKESFLRLEVDP
jgi:hypothetical protein